MRYRHFFAAVAIVCLALGAIELAHGRASETDPAATVVRAKAFELVDDQGRVRMEIKVFPAQPHFKMPDGTIGYPEAVQFRMITSQGAPNVKIVATEDGAAASFVGEKGAIVISSRSQGDPLISTYAKDGRKKVLTP